MHLCALLANRRHEVRVEAASRNPQQRRLLLARGVCPGNARLGQSLQALHVKMMPPGWDGRRIPLYAACHDPTIDEWGDDVELERLSIAVLTFPAPPLADERYVESRLQTPIRLLGDSFEHVPDISVEEARHMLRPDRRRIVSRECSLEARDECVVEGKGRIVDPVSVRRRRLGSHAALTAQVAEVDQLVDHAAHGRIGVTLESRA